MPANLPLDDLRRNFDEFVRFRKEHLRGDEKGEAQVFLDRFFQALGYGGVFEAGATLEMRVRRRDAGGTAFADLVWKPRVLIEMKKARQPLARHYRQAFEYWIDLVPDRPKYVILCNFDELWIYDLNQQLDEPVDTIALADLSRRWEALAFLLPIEEQPQFGNDLVAVTRDSAATMSQVFNLLVSRRIGRATAQRFILQSLMAMFSEDIGLLPRHVFTQAIDSSLSGGSAYDLLFGLFREMNAPGQTPAGRYAGTPYFNGGLFREVLPFELEREELEQLQRASRFDWSAVRPAIFGTLFEQSLEMQERHAYGAHFTSETDIQKVVLPTIVRPWRDRIEAATSLEELGEVEQSMLQYRVLDPACGCGNFLYVAYRELRRLEHELIEKMRSRRRRRGADTELALSFVSARQFYGLDINSFAVEIAKVTLMLARKLAADELGDEQTVLPLDDLDANFQAADALQVQWPTFDACIGNPPYLGRRLIIEQRGAPYAAWLAENYPEVGGVSDYVVYWFRKAHDLLPVGGRAGLVGTNTIRQGASRRASLDYIIDEDGFIYDAVSSQPWSGDAAVSVSIVNWAKGLDLSPKVLWLSDGTVKLEVNEINGSLSASIDLRDARPLEVNKRPKVCFQGQTPGHTRGFVLRQQQAQDLVVRDARNASVLHPYLIGDELVADGQPTRFIVDFPETDAALARTHAPDVFDRIQHLVLPDRRRMAEEEAQRNRRVLSERPGATVNWHHRRFLDGWWQLSYRRGEMLDAISRLPRYIGLSRIASEHRDSIYSFISPEIRPSDVVQVFSFSDDYSFGILQSSIHRRWFEARCSTLETRLRYTATTVFDSFPWPQSPTQDMASSVAKAAKDLLDFRHERLADGVSLGAQYDALRVPGRNPLRRLHQALDEAVFDAYGFTGSDDVLAQMLALNRSIADEESGGITRPRGPGNIGLAETEITTWRIEPNLRLDAE